MKIFLKTGKKLLIIRNPMLWALIFNLLNIFIFWIIYYFLLEDFEFRGVSDLKSNRKESAMDLLLLSTTIQAGVGITNVYPKTTLTSWLLVLQQLIMISGNILAFYINTTK
jgi:hypothetical protein